MSLKAAAVALAEAANLQTRQDLSNYYGPGVEQIDYVTMMTPPGTRGMIPSGTRVRYVRSPTEGEQVIFSSGADSFALRIDRQGNGFVEAGSSIGWMQQEIILAALLQVAKQVEDGSDGT